MTVAELIDLLMGFPEEEEVKVPDFNSYDNYPVKNAVLTKDGVLLDY